MSHKIFERKLLAVENPGDFFHSFQFGGKNYIIYRRIVRGARSKNWYVHFRSPEGKQVNHCLGTPQKGEAIERARGKIRAANDGHWDKLSASKLRHDGPRDVMVKLRGPFGKHPGKIYELGGLLSGGVYVLLNGEEIVYVGQTHNVSRRLYAHIGSKKQFDRIYFLPCSAEQANSLERRIISHIDPVHNRDAGLTTAVSPYFGRKARGKSSSINLEQNCKPLESS